MECLTHIGGTGSPLLSADGHGPAGCLPPPWLSPRFQTVGLIPSRRSRRRHSTDGGTQQMGKNCKYLFVKIYFSTFHSRSTIPAAVWPCVTRTEEVLSAWFLSQVPCGVWGLPCHPLPTPCPSHRWPPLLTNGSVQRKASPKTSKDC